MDMDRIRRRMNSAHNSVRADCMYVGANNTIFCLALALTCCSLLLTTNIHLYTRTGWYRKDGDYEGPIEGVGDAMRGVQLLRWA